MTTQLFGIICIVLILGIGSFMVLNKGTDLEMSSFILLGMFFLSIFVGFATQLNDSNDQEATKPNCVTVETVEPEVKCINLDGEIYCTK